MSTRKIPCLPCDGKGTHHTDNSFLVVECDACKGRGYRVPLDTRTDSKPGKGRS